MPSPILHAGATVSCAHGGRAVPSAPSARVRVAGRPVTTAADHYQVSGCPFGEDPCVTVNWSAAAGRVRVGGTPVLLAASQGVCMPNGTPLTIGATQQRVTAS